MLQDTGPAGHCQICERLIMSNEKTGLLAKHGYSRPGHGWLEGMCMGADALPYEKAKDQLELYREKVVRYKEDEEKYLSRLQNGGVKSLPDRTVYISRERREKGESPPSIDVTHSNWKRTLELFVSDTKRSITSATKELERIDQRLADWKPDQPLGEKGKSGAPMVMRLEVGKIYLYDGQEMEVLSKPHSVRNFGGRMSYDGAKVRRLSDNKEFIVRARSLKPKK